jgi:NAD+ kinase
MKFGVVANIELQQAVGTARDVIIFLNEHAGCEEVIAEEALGSKLKLNIKSMALNNMQVDVLITVGGDGTILRALQHCNAMIFGINVGVLGFLTEVKPEDAKAGLERVLANEYIIDTRVRLKTMLNEERLVDSVNEAVIHTAHIAKMRQFEICVDESPAAEFRADGVIIATPTGSTSYAMSAGGPIMDPRVEAFIVVPIAPFKLSARPLVVPLHSKISIRFLDPGRPSVLVLDGQYERKITSEDVVHISVSESRARFIKFDTDFYRKVTEKLVL